MGNVLHLSLTTFSTLYLKYVIILGEKIAIITTIFLKNTQLQHDEINRSISYQNSVI